MRLVTSEEFLTLPSGTLYAKYQPCVFEDLQIKGHSIGDCSDFFYQQIVDSLDNDNFVDAIDCLSIGGPGIPLEFQTQSRDGMFDTGQIYAVWEREDVIRLIDRLREALADGYSTGDDVK